ncbi:MAG: Cell shape-determining protein MreC precursor [Actinobacteria bacterium ADurb.Bin444]|nr:MAG: Cell shape-determining protein MreC precursor [Actinobacteria bacterium ADurb.Bin444]
MQPQKELGRRRLVLTALVLTSLVLITLFLRETSDGALHRVQDAGLGTMSPIQSFATRAVQPFQEAWRYVSGLWSAYEENRELSAEVEVLRGQLIQMQEAGEENARLKQLLDFQESGIFPAGSTFCVARVIGRSPTRWQEWIQIDKGTADGLAVNQPVVGTAGPAGDSLSGKGLVGKVMSVTAHSAQIQLISDPESSVAALVQGTRAEGILEGSVTGHLLMDFVERDQPVVVGSVVITSGSSQVFPKGIPIGKVVSVGEEDVNIYKTIEVQAFVDVRSLEEVMVLTNPPQRDGTDSRQRSTGVRQGTGGR